MKILKHFSSKRSLYYQGENTQAGISPKRKILTLSTVFLTAAVLFACVLFLADTPPKCNVKMPILMYHDLTLYPEECDDMTITAKRMENDLKWLADNNYTAILPRELNTLIKEKKLTEKHVMITFDDGYLSNYELLFPLLKKYNMKAAISIVVSNADRNAAGCLTWDMCREMSDSGSIEIDSHTYNLHNPETSGVYMSDGANGIQRKYCESISSYYLRVIRDIEKSYQRINDEIGIAPAMLAYPYGISDRWALECAHRLFSVTAVTQNNIADLSNGPYELSRFSINMNVSLSDILNN